MTTVANRDKEIGFTPIVTATKICSGCKIEKPLTEYYKNNKVGHGHANYCKVCALAAAHTYQKKKKSRHDIYCRSVLRQVAEVFGYRFTRDALDTLMEKLLLLDFSKSSIHRNAGRLVREHVARYKFAKATRAINRLAG